MNLQLNLYSVNEIWNLFSKINYSLLTEKQKKVGVVGIAALALISLYAIGCLMRRCCFKAMMIDPQKNQGGVSVSVVGFKPVSEMKTKANTSDKATQVDLNFCLTTLQANEEAEHILDKEQVNQHYVNANLITPPRRIFSSIKKLRCEDLEAIAEDSKDEASEIDDQLTPANQLKSPTYPLSKEDVQKFYDQMKKAMVDFGDCEMSCDEPSRFMSPADKVKEFITPYKKKREQREESLLSISQLLNLNGSMQLDMSMSQLNPKAFENGKLLTVIDELLQSEMSDGLRDCLQALRDAELQAIEEWKTLFDEEDNAV